MKDKKIVDKEMVQARYVNQISAPGNIQSSTKASTMNNDVSCIYNNRNQINTLKLQAFRYSK